MSKIKIALFSVLFLSLLGCESDRDSGRSIIAPEIAPADSAVATPSPKAAARAAGAGALASAAKSLPLNKEDLAEMRRAELRAYTAPIGQKITWRNAKTGFAGSLAPLRDFYAQNGDFCREFDQMLVVGKQQQQNTIHACQQSNGTWKIAP